MNPNRIDTKRRQFLRGIGVCMALPALESLQSPKVFANDSLTAAMTPTGAPLRSAFIYFPNGAIPNAWWPLESNKADAKLYAKSNTLKPLEHHRDSIQVLKGLDNLSADGGPDGGGDHARGNGTFLTGGAQDVDGKSLLHNSMIVYGSGNADGNKHTHSDLPIVLAGNGGGALTPGRFVDHRSKPLTNLYLSMAERMGVQDLGRFGDSTDRLSNL